MFGLRFFGSFGKQRQQMLTAESFADMPLHPAVTRQLNALVDEALITPTFTRPVQIFFYSLRAVRQLIVANLLWSALNAVVVLAAVLVTREIVQGGHSVGIGILIACTYVVLKLLQATIDYRNHLRRLQIYRGLQVSLYRLVNSKLLRLDSVVPTGQLKTIVGSDVESVEGFVGAALHQWIPTGVSILVLVPALWIVSGSVGIFALLVGLLLLPIATAGARIIEVIQHRSQAEQDSLTTLVGEWVKNIRLVRYLGWQPAFESELFHRMRRFSLLSALRHTFVIIVFSISFSWSMMPMLAIFFVSSMREQPLNLVEVFSTFWILDHLMFYIQHIPHSISMYGTAAAGARRIFDLLQAPELDRFISPAPEAAEPPELGIAEAIVLKDVTVQFGEVVVLSLPALTLRLQESTAIVGMVGSGKSTLLELLIGERHPSSGTIEIVFSKAGALPLWREDVYSAFRSQLAYSPQQPFLSNASMRLNIDLSGGRSAAEVQDALDAAQLQPDILLFTRGLEEEVGESGINLSGGQRQRISLARAFISRRPVLVLDDPLSAVDVTTENQLMNEILDRSKGLVLVSHRLHELTRCSRVIVLTSGEIEEDGVPRELLAKPDSAFLRFLRAVENE